MRSTKSPNLEFFSEILQNMKLKDLASFFLFLLRFPCMKSA